MTSENLTDGNRGLMCWGKASSQKYKPKIVIKMLKDLAMSPPISHEKEWQKCRVSAGSQNNFIFLLTVQRICI